jgi:hypothetical protein
MPEFASNFIRVPDSRGEGKMSLLQRKNFVMHSGQSTTFKIECDALSGEDIATLAEIIAQRFAFSAVHGVPRGGLRIAAALEPFRTSGPPLIVDDVLTTGASMEEVRRSHPGAIGVVLFARSVAPAWVHPVFQLWCHPAAALSQARNEALEQAASAIDCDCEPAGFVCVGNAARYCSRFEAEEIRSLIKQEDGK